MLDLHSACTVPDPLGRMEAMATQDSSRITGTEVSHSSRQALLWMTIGYGLMILGAIGTLLLISRYGETLSAPSAAAKAFTEVTAVMTNVLLHVLAALTAVIVTGLILARIFAYLGQPPVIGEVVAGIVLGPSLLGPEVP